MSNELFTKLCPSIGILSSLMKTESLSDKHLSIGKDIITEMAKSSDELLKQDLLITNLDGFTDGIYLFKNEFFEMRAHLFYEDTVETFIHNHTQSFLSFCIEGGYTQKLWEIIDSNDENHYTFTRKTGGFYTDAKKETGKLLHIFTHNFERNQSIFVSAHAKHSLIIFPKGRTISIVIRDEREKKITNLVFSKTTQIEGPHNLSIKYENEEKKQEIKDIFKASLKNNLLK
jgi:hypothetical protein